MNLLKIGILMAVVVVVLLAGCQQPGRVVSTERVETCPECEKQMVTSRVSGLNFEKMYCPTCDKEYVPPKGFYNPDTIVYNCPSCGKVEATCPSCLKKALPPAVWVPMESY